MVKNICTASIVIAFLSFPLVLWSSDVFPYDTRIEKLENGLTVVSVPLKNPHIISYYTIVRSGSRNEIEPGKSGFAHFFEHMMFKGTKNIPREKYDDFLTELGAGTNGYTSDDYTCYFVVFAGRENLEKVVKTEADRFINLYYNEEMLKTEAPVIEGEYYSSVSNPGRRLYETLRHEAFEKHSYKHTTLGYLEDIQDMPNQFEYSKLYKKRFYAPDNSIILVVGDYDHEQLIEYIKKYYGVWSSPLYQRLVIEEQKCLSIYADFPDRRDPPLLTFNAVVKQEEDLPYVEQEIFTELEHYKNEPIPEDKLEEVKSNIKYSLARQLGTTDGTAGTTPQNIQEMAQKYFTKKNSTVVTLSGGEEQ